MANDPQTTGPTLTDIRAYVSKKYKLQSGWRTKFAKECGLSQSMVSAVFLGTRKIPEKMAKVVGWRHVWVKR